MRVVVITGGTKGLGRETALEFARRGSFVFALYHADEAAACEFQETLVRLGGKGCAVRHDIAAAEGGADDFWNRAEIREAESLVLINNASAPFQPTPLHHLHWTEFARQLEVAVHGSWHCTQAILRPMIRTGGGVIVNVLTSALEGLPPKGFAAYTTAKHALRGLTLSLAGELSARGIRVFSVSPGLMRTTLTASWDPRLLEAISSAGTRVTDPASAAGRIADLVSDEKTPGLGEDYPL